MGQYASMIREARIITIDEDGDADDFVAKKQKVFRPLVKLTLESWMCIT